MKRAERRHRVTSLLLQAAEPIDAGRLAQASGLADQELLATLDELIIEGLVVDGDLDPDQPGPQYRWAARWHERADEGAADAKQQFTAQMAPLETKYGHRFDIEDEPATAFYEHVINGYQPPGNKRFLVVLQCSVRRPFSSSPSHASMRRAISTATGFDPTPSPAGDDRRCPVHVVVLASRIGPVPYDLQDVYPANVRSGGVKHFDHATYERYRPILAARMAGYLIAHGRRYRRAAAFCEGRYGQIMRDVGEIGLMDLPVLPDGDSPRVLRSGKSTPRTYWEKYWIQLHLEIAGWLDPAGRRRAQSSIEALEVQYS